MVFLGDGGSSTGRLSVVLWWNGAAITGDHVLPTVSFTVSRVNLCVCFCIERAACHTVEAPRVSTLIAVTRSLVWRKMQMDFC